MKQIIVILIVSMLVGCGTTKTLRYYKTAGDEKAEITKKDESEKNIAVNAFVLDPSASTNKTITDLAEEGQAQLIVALANRTKTTAELLSAMAQAIKDPSPIGGIKGSKSWKKRVVINIVKNDPERANRIEKILFDLEIPTEFKDKVSFIGWDKVATETQSIDLGKISSGTTLGSSFSPEITMAGTIQGKLPGALTASKTVGIEKTYTARLAGLNAALVNKSKFQVYRQALPNEDITGNIVVELTLLAANVKETPVYAFIGLYPDNKLMQDPAKIEVINTLIVKPDLGADTFLPITLTHHYNYRRVDNDNGKRTEPEYDDEITRVTGNITEDKKFNLFEADDLAATKTWEIEDSGKSLYLFRNLDGPVVLKFESHKEAQLFLRWLNDSQNIKVGDYDIYLGDKAALKKADIKNLNVILGK